MISIRPVFISWLIAFSGLTAAVGGGGAYAMGRAPSNSGPTPATPAPAVVKPVVAPPVAGFKVQPRPGLDPLVNRGIQVNALAGVGNLVQAEPLPDGRMILLAVDEVYGTPRLARLRADGSIDPTFRQGGARTLIYGYPSGQYRDFTYRLIDGATHSEYSNLLQHATIQVGTDGRINILGGFGSMLMRIRLDASGEIDRTFGDQGVQVVDIRSVASLDDPGTSYLGAIRLNRDGQAIVQVLNGFSQPTYDPSAGKYKREAGTLLRLNADGTLDRRFGVKGLLRLPGVLTSIGYMYNDDAIYSQADGSILFLASREYLQRISGDGSRLAAFEFGFWANQFTSSSLTVNPRGATCIGNSWSWGTLVSALNRPADGTKGEVTFGQVAGLGGFATLQAHEWASGTVLAIGFEGSSKLALRVVTPDGKADPAFSAPAFELRGMSENGYIVLSRKVLTVENPDGSVTVIVKDGADLLVMKVNDFSQKEFVFDLPANASLGAKFNLNPRGGRTPYNLKIVSGAGTIEGTTFTSKVPGVVAVELTDTDGRKVKKEITYSNASVLTVRVCLDALSRVKIENVNQVTITRLGGGWDPGMHPDCRFYGNTARNGMVAGAIDPGCAEVNWRDPDAHFSGHGWEINGWDGQATGSGPFLADVNDQAPGAHDHHLVFSCKRVK
jgi:hypothetical protein